MRKYMGTLVKQNSLLVFLIGVVVDEEGQSALMSGETEMQVRVIQAASDIIFSLDFFFFSRSSQVPQHTAF